MGHEFRTPLNGIIGLTRLLSGRPDRTDEEIKQILYIQRSAEDLTELVNDLLDLAKAEAGKLTVHAGDFDVANVFGALRGMFRALTTTDSVSLVFEDPGSTLSLHTDESKVSQILRNFVSNALKFTEHGEVRVCAAHNAEWDEIIFSVTDTGIGIAPEHQERIFEEFAQIDSPMQRRVKGTGLGLPLCKRLAELLGGMVTVSSRPGIGSRFTAHIPRRYQGDSLNLRPAAGQRRLLVIDDEEISRYLLRQLLTGGYEILEASGGEDGLKQARESKPDMIFLDLAMPGLNGFEVLTQLKADPKTSSIPIVIVTAQTLEPDEERLLAQGTVAILSKNALARAAALSVEFSPKIAVSARYVRAS
jgi:CheY-like chemotaxis protein